MTEVQEEPIEPDDVPVTAEAAALAPINRLNRDPQQLLPVLDRFFDTLNKQNQSELQATFHRVLGNTEQIIQTAQRQSALFSNAIDDIALHKSLALEAQRLLQNFVPPETALKQLAVSMPSLSRFSQELGRTSASFERARLDVEATLKQFLTPTWQDTLRGVRAAPFISGVTSDSFSLMSQGALAAIEKFRLQTHAIPKLFDSPGWQEIFRNAQRYMQEINEQAAEFIRSLTSDPFVNDVFKVMVNGDVDAARRLAERIPWRPTGLKVRQIALRAKLESKPYKSILLEALTEGVMLAISSMHDPLPMMVSSERRCLYSAEGELVTVKLMEWSVPYAFDWVEYESVRAAESLLFALPYSPSVVIRRAPAHDGDIELDSFGLVEARALPSGPSRGRPVGSGIFSSKESFLLAVRQAAEEVRGRGRKLTQEEVASVLAMRGFMDMGHPARQLRIWTEEFGFGSWSELRKHI